MEKEREKLLRSEQLFAEKIKLLYTLSYQIVYKEYFFSIFMQIFILSHSAKNVILFFILQYFIIIY